ncbi:MAG: MFS transporter [Chloroflexia bacterium]
MGTLTFRELVFLNGYWTGLSFMWTGLHVIVLPAVLLHFVPEGRKNTYLGLLTFVGLVIAAVVQPIAGALSDRWTSRWGRRRPLILLGTVLDMVFLALLAWAGGLWALALGYIGLQLTSNIAHGALQGLIPDRVPPWQLGQASGVKTVMDISGTILASIVLGRLVTPDTRQPLLAIGAVAVCLSLGGAVTLGGTLEHPRTSAALAGWRTFWKEFFRVDLRRHSGYAWLIASRFVFLLGMYGIQAFAQYYLRDRLQVPNPPKAAGDLMAALVAALLLAALGAGWLSDRWGSRRVLALAGVVTAAGSLLLLAARRLGELIPLGSVFGVGLGMFLSANWALASAMAPDEDSGKFLGLTNLSTAGAAALGRLEGPLIDLLNGIAPGRWWGYTALFVFGAVCALLSVIVLQKVGTTQETRAAA